MQSIANEAVTMSESFYTSKKLVDDYVELWKVKPSKVDKIRDNPNYHKVRTIVEGLKEILAQYQDPRDAKYGKMHLITAVHQLPGGPPGPIPKSVDQGIPMLNRNHDVLERNEDICRWNYNQTQYLNDMNVPQRMHGFVHPCTI